MFKRRTLAAFTAVAGLAGATAGSAMASADPAPPGDDPLGSLIQKKPVPIAASSAASQPQGTRCRAWRVQGQTWYAGQGSFTLMFTLRTATSTPSRFSGYARYYKSDYGDLVPSQYIRGYVGSNSKGIVGIHMDIVWSNGSSGQYNATAYAARPTSSGGLTASLHGTTVDTSGNGGPGARWYADGLEGPLGDNGFIRPLYCPPRDVVR
jgi:hypothetical protein